MVPVAQHDVVVIVTRIPHVQSTLVQPVVDRLQEGSQCVVLLASGVVVARHGEAPELARDFVGEDIVHLPVDPLEVCQRLVVFRLARQLTRPPRSAFDTATDVVRRGATHTEPAPVLAHLIDLPAEQMDDASGARQARRLAAPPLAHGIAVKQVIVLVVAVDEEGRPWAVVEPVDEELLL